jgi:heme exporter protein A
LVLSRGGRTLIAGLSFRVDAGEALVLTGPNGVGKTTLLAAIAGLLPPDHGSIRLVGAAEDERPGDQSHFIGHLNALKAGLTVAENLTFWARYLDGDPACADAVLDRLRLAAIGHVPAGYLSAGQKRRLSLARLLVASRPLWLLDEPTVSLDAESRELAAGLISDHLASGGIVVAATHLPLGIPASRELVLRARPADFADEAAL